jgi:hypothetical protein
VIRRRAENAFLVLSKKERKETMRRRAREDETKANRERQTVRQTDRQTDRDLDELSFCSRRREKAMQEPDHFRVSKLLCVRVPAQGVHVLGQLIKGKRTVFACFDERRSRETFLVRTLMG